MGPESSGFARGSSHTTYTTSHVRHETARSRSPPDSQRYAQERADVERDGPEQQGKSSTSPGKDQGSLYSREGEGTRMRDEVSETMPAQMRYSNTVLHLQSRSLKDEDQRQRRYDGDRTDDRRDTLRGMRYPSLKENYDIQHRPSLASARGVEPTAPASSSFQHLYEAQSSQLSALQREHQMVLEEKKALAEAYATLEHRHEERSKKLAVVRHERQDALQRMKEIDAAYGALRLQYEEQSKKLDSVRYERQSAREQKQKVEEDYVVLRQKYDTQKNDYNALSNKCHSLKATLEQRTSELQGVQKFLTTANTFSGAEVVNMLRKLNEDVQQSAAYMAEWAVENFTLETPLPDQMVTETIEQTRTSERLGMRLMQLLGTRNHKDNPLLVEMAFRAYLIYSLYWIASRWSMGQEEQSHNAYIGAIYQRMRETGEAVFICCRIMLT